MCFYLFVSVRIYISLCVHICVAVASVLSAFVMFLVWPCFSKTIRVIHCFYHLINPCKREESLLGILSLESQTSLVVIKNPK